MFFIKSIGVWFALLAVLFFIFGDSVVVILYCVFSPIILLFSWWNHSHSYKVMGCPNPSCNRPNAMEEVSREFIRTRDCIKRVEKTRRVYDSRLKIYREETYFDKVEGFQCVYLVTEKCKFCGTERKKVVSEEY